MAQPHSPSLPTVTAARHPEEAWRDAWAICLAVCVIAGAAYGMFDLLVAPHTTPHQSRLANGQPRRTGGGFLGSVFGREGVELCPGQNQINILILGTDERTEGGRADTIILVMIRKDTRRVAAISVPRDLMVRTQRGGTQKINGIYANYRRKGLGETMMARTVAQMLGVQVDYYIKTDVSKFAQLFDAFGGLDLYVDRDMEYHDRAGQLHISLKKGYQHLNGKQIEGFVRHRHDRRGEAHYSTDYERNQRQQYVLKELVRQKSNLATAARLPQIIYAIEDMIKTNMTVPELIALGLLARTLDTDHVISRMVPTHAYLNGGWYAVMEPEATRRMMAEVETALAGGPIIRDTNPNRNDKIAAGTLNPPEPAKQEAPPGQPAQRPRR